MIRDQYSFGYAFPEGSRGQHKPSAAVKPVEVKQCITKFTQYKNYKWKTNALSKKKLVGGPKYSYMYVSYL